MIRPQIHNDEAPANYDNALRDVSAWAPEDAIISSEGATTMDTGRTQLPNFRAWHRLDAGSYGTMAVGLGIMISARGGARSWPGPSDNSPTTTSSGTSMPSQQSSTPSP